MLITLFGIVMQVRRLQVENATVPMPITLVPIVTLVRLGHSSNASIPMFVMLLGIVTLVMERPVNAALPMLVIGRPLVVLGMITILAVPVYLVIVSVLSGLVVYVYWACTTAGKASMAANAENNPSCAILGIKILCCKRTHTPYEYHAPSRKRHKRGTRSTPQCARSERRTK